MLQDELRAMREKYSQLQAEKDSECGVLRQALQERENRLIDLTKSTGTELLRDAMVPRSVFVSSVAQVRARGTADVHPFGG